MIRLVEVFVALVIVAILAALFGVFLPNHRHIDRQITLSSPIRQIYDVLDGFRTYPSWSGLRSYDPHVRFDFENAERGTGAKVDWVSADPRITKGSFTILPEPVEDKQVRWSIDNTWKGTGKVFTYDLDPSENGKTVKVTLGYDVDYGWDLIGRYSGLYVGGEPSTMLSLHLAELEKFMAAIPNIDYKDQTINIADVTSKPILFVSTTAKRTLDDVADATDKALTAINADIKKNNLTQAGPRMTITSNFGEDKYDFDIALPVDHNDITPTDPVKAGKSYGGKALTNSFTGSPAQLNPIRNMLRAYATTHGYAFDDSGTGLGRAYDELTTTDANAADDQQSFTVTLPITLQQ